MYLKTYWWLIIWWNPAPATAGFAVQIRQNPAPARFPKSKSGTALTLIQQTRQNKKTIRNQQLSCRTMQHLNNSCRQRHKYGRMIRRIWSSTLSVEGEAAFSRWSELIPDVPVFCLKGGNLCCWNEHYLCCLICLHLCAFSVSAPDLFWR